MHYMHESSQAENACIGHVKTIQALQACHANNPIFLHQNEDQFIQISSAVRRFLRLFRLVAASPKVKETLQRQVLDTASSAMLCIDWEKVGRDRYGTKDGRGWST